MFDRTESRGKDAESMKEREEYLCYVEFMGQKAFDEESIQREL